MFGVPTEFFQQDIDKEIQKHFSQICLQIYALLFFKTLVLVKCYLQIWNAIRVYRPFYKVIALRSG